MLPRPAKAPLKAKCSDKMNDESNLIKKHPKGDFFFFYLCVLLNILFRMRSLAAPSQGSQTSVNNLPCAKKKEKRKPTHTYTTLTKKGRIWAAPHGWAPRTLVVCMKPESRGADKMWNSWRGTGGKVSNKYLHMWRLEGGGGLPNVFMSWTPKMNTPDFCSPVPTFFLNLHKPMWELSILLLLLPIIIIIDVTF